MTTTVSIHVTGNKAVEINTSDSNPPLVIHPGQVVQRHIHGDVALSVQEVGDLLKPGKLEYVETAPAAIPAIS